MTVIGRPRSLSAAQEAEVRRRYAAWETQDELAGAFGVSKGVIYRVVRRVERLGERPHRPRKPGRSPVRFEPTRHEPLINAPAQVYFVARNRATDEYLRQQGRDGHLLAKPVLFISRRRGKQALSLRTTEVADPGQWELVPVQLTPVLQAAE